MFTKQKARVGRNNQRALRRISGSSYPSVAGVHPAIKKNSSAWRPGYSDINFDVNGHIKNAIDRVGNRTIQYVSDAQGMILLRDEITGTITPPNYRHHPANYNPGTAANKVARYYYVDGQRVGDISNIGDSKVDYLQSLKDRKDKKSGNYA